MSKEALEILDELVGKEATRQKRLTRLLRSPEEKFTNGWFMCVPDCFLECLDIRHTERSSKEKGRKEFVWTQGSAFCFSKGYTLYDTKDAYLDKWAEALKTVSLCVQVTDSLPAGPGSDGERFPGSVSFRVLKPDKKRTKLGPLPGIDKVMSQDGFVRFLIEGWPEKQKGLL